MNLTVKLPDSVEFNDYIFELVNNKEIGYTNRCYLVYLLTNKLNSPEALFRFQGDTNTSFEILMDCFRKGCIKEQITRASVIVKFSPIYLNFPPMEEFESLHKLYDEFVLGKHISRTLQETGNYVNSVKDSLYKFFINNRKVPAGLAHNICKSMMKGIKEYFDKSENPENDLNFLLSCIEKLKSDTKNYWYLNIKDFSGFMKYCATVPIEFETMDTVYCFRNPSETFLGILMQYNPSKSITEDGVIYTLEVTNSIPEATLQLFKDFRVN